MAVLARLARKPVDWSDEELLANVLRNQGVAWSELVRRYRALIYRCISKVTLRYAPTLASADMDEIYAEVMIQLVRDDMHKLRIYDPGRGAKLGSWIGMLAVNAAYDYLRSAGRRPILNREGNLIETNEEHDRSPLDHLLEKERWDHLNGMLMDFTDKDRTFVDLYYRRGMEAEQVAEEMQISLKTVYSKKHKIRAHLMRCLERMAGESPIADLAAAA